MTQQEVSQQPNISVQEAVAPAQPEEKGMIASAVDGVKGAVSGTVSYFGELGDVMMKAFAQRLATREAPALLAAGVMALAESAKQHHNDAKPPQDLSHIDVSGAKPASVAVASSPIPANTTATDVSPASVPVVATTSQEPQLG